MQANERLGARPGEGRQDRQPSLTIVIPALNEDAAIGATIERCLAVRAEILASTDVRAVDVVVVSDGSTDRTAEIALSHAEVQVIVFAENRGYGAAIQAGWRQCPNDLLGFLDADGTCDPAYFVPLCNAITREGYDIALGSRMGPDSRMPLMRRVGNRAYALLLRLLSHRVIADTASGMRVVRRDALPRLLPLPDGLHFTPAMSARAALDDIPMAEIPMSYQERIGCSKLRVVRDGLRFLHTILSTVLYVRPSRLLLPVVLLLLLASAGMLGWPALQYARFHYVEEWLLYRFLFSALLVTVAAMLLNTTCVLEQLIAVSRGDYERRVAEGGSWWLPIGERTILAAGVVLAAFGVYLAWPAIVTYTLTRHVTAHWSRIVVAMVCEMLAAQVAVGLLVNGVVRGVVRQQAAWLNTLRAGSAEEVERPPLPGGSRR